MHPVLRTMRREIVFILLIKMALLFVIWKVCFSHPLRHTLADTEMRQHIISSQQQGEPHGS